MLDRRRQAQRRSSSIRQNDRKPWPPAFLISFEFMFQPQRYENSLEIPVPFNRRPIKLRFQKVDNPHSINVTNHLLQRCLSFFQHDVLFYNIVPSLFELKPFLIIMNGLLSFNLMIMNVI